jgi:hypothetical protein
MSERAPSRARATLANAATSSPSTCLPVHTIAGRWEQCLPSHRSDTRPGSTLAAALAKPGEDEARHLRPHVSWSSASRLLRCGSVLTDLIDLINGCFAHAEPIDRADYPRTWLSAIPQTRGQFPVVTRH